MLKRIIPSLLLRDGRLVKGVGYTNHRDAGRPDTTARAYNAQGADELILLDIEASRERREPSYTHFAAVAANCMMPLTVGGGITSIDIARRCMDTGSDKICLTTTALDNPALIGRLARLFGTQAIVVGIDVLETPDGRQLYDHRVRAPVATVRWHDWLTRVVEEGAGEIRLMSVIREGGRRGLDLALHAEASALVNVPIILEGGAGSLDQIAEAMREGVEAVAIGTMLVFSDNNITKVKSFLRNGGLEIRL